jgi:dihydrofolate reductase
MGSVIVAMFVSLDGVVEAPEKWSSKYWNDDIEKLKRAELFDAADALLLGRVTYQGFADSWPHRSGEWADRMNSLPKHVASTTLKDLAWNNSHLIKGDLAQHVSKLKQTYARDILVYGGTTMVSALASHNLVDEYRLLVYPVVLGGGKRLFKDGTTATLTLTESRTCHPNVVFMRYQRAR